MDAKEYIEQAIEKEIDLEKHAIDVFKMEDLIFWMESYHQAKSKEEAKERYKKALRIASGKDES